MESIPIIFAIVFIVGGALALFGYFIFLLVRYPYWYWIRSIEPERKIILERYFLYYRNLPQKLKKRFENRAVLFIRSKDWYGQEGLEISEEMKVLIAATAVQITFGLKVYQLPRFTKIFVYPHVYYNQQTKNYHKGEVYPLGKVIKLSWDNFLKGFSDPKDGINLGLHEMTHAMSLENQFAGNNAYGFISPRVYHRWEILAHEEIAYIKAGNKSLFREYAATNLHEFLAVSIEVFFEQPNEFREYNLPLFKETCDLLNQYPV